MRFATPSIMKEKSALGNGFRHPHAMIGNQCSKIEVRLRIAIATSEN